MADYTIQPHGIRFKVFHETILGPKPCNIGKEFHPSQLEGFATMEEAEAHIRWLRSVDGSNVKKKRR